MNRASHQGDRWVALLQRIADRADAIALEAFRSDDLLIESKSDASPVTRADRGIEEAARELIRRHEPGLGIFGEEYGETIGSFGTRLIIDPIDGTENFIRGIPIFATLLAIEENGEIIAALASAPAMGCRWTAVRGGGAWSGTRRLSVSGVDEIAHGQVFHADFPPEAGGPPARGIERLLRRARRTRGFGDFYQHVLVAEGAGEIAIDPAVRPWDIAPLLLIVEEAGGAATTLGGERTIFGGSFLSSNGVVHREALRILAAAGGAPG